MALNNCTINSSSVNVTQGQALGTTASQVLTITPDVGYVVAASDFTNNTGSLSGSPIASITFKDVTSGLGTAIPYHDDNVVQVICDLDNSYVANASIDYIIDIDGDALDKKGREYTISGTHDAAVSNATPASYTGQTYTGSGVEGSIVTLFTKTFTASTNFCFLDAASFPSATITTGTASNYIIEYEDTHNGTFFNRLISRKFIVKYKFPAAMVSGDNIDFSAQAKGIPSTDTENSDAIIRSLVMDQTGIIKSGEERVLSIFGTPTANFELTVTKNSDNKTYDFASEEEDKFTTTATKLDNVNIGSDGKHEVVIVFPATGLSSEQYKIKVTAESGTSISNAITNYNNANPNITLTQQNDVTITLTTVNGSNISSRTTSAITGGYEQVGIADAPAASKESISYTVVSTSNMFVARQPIFPDDFSNVDATSSEFYLSKPTVSGSGGKTLTITSPILRVYDFGTANITSALNLTNILSAAPTTSNFTSTGNEDTTQNITLASHISNPSGGTLTYSIVADNTGSNGTLTLTSAANGTVTYVPAANNNTNVSFTYKVNNGVQDSNTSTATVNVTAVPDAPTNIILSAVSIEEGNSIGDAVGSMQATDADGASHTFALVTGTGSTNNSSFSITGTSLKAAEVFDFSVKSSYSIRLRATDPDGGYFEKAFTISITETSVTRFQMDVFNAAGQYQMTHFIHGTQTCSGGSLAATCMSFGSLTNKWVRWRAGSNSCGSTEYGRGKIIGGAANGAPTAIVSGDTYYNSMADSQNSSNGQTC
tara:strand:+ start:1935 stop:4247 length:2313 start_codon:yes stop_codon:yes gene_type:complete